MEDFQQHQLQLMKKQLRYTRIFAFSNIILVVVLLFTVFHILPMVTDTLKKASEALGAANVIMEELGPVAENVNSLVDESSTAIELTMEKINSMDIEELNKAIKNLSDVVQPLADFFGKFR